MTDLMLSDKKGSISRTTKNKLLDILEKGISDGKSYGAIAKEIREVDPFVFSRARAKTIATNELGRAYGWANYEPGRVLTEEGYILVKYWQTSEDDKVRPTHMQNQEADKVDFTAEFPGTGDMYAPSTNDINCRCTSTHEIVGIADGKGIRHIHRGTTGKEIKKIFDFIKKASIITSKNTATQTLRGFYFNILPHMKKVLYFQAKLEVTKEQKDGSIKIKGFASTPDKDRYNDIVLVTAFNKSLPLFLKNPIMLLQHDDNKVIGRFPAAVTKSSGLEVDGEVMYDIDDCFRKINDGVLGAFSIGFITQAYQYEDEAGHIIYQSGVGLSAGYDWNDLDREGVKRVITEVDLVEISVVSTPANPYALFQAAKAFFAEETKSLKAYGPLERRGAPNETGEETPETPAPEVTPPAEPETPTIDPAPTEVPAQDEPKPTEGEGKEAETPPSEETPTADPATPAEEVTAPVVKADEEPEETPKNVTLEEVKALIAASVGEAIGALTQALESKLSEGVTDIKTLVGTLETKQKALEDDLLNIETLRPGKKQEQKDAPKLITKQVAVTDELVIASLHSRY